MNKQKGERGVLFTMMHDDTGGFIRREMELPQNAHLRGAEDGRAPRVMPKEWATALRITYKKARTFDWAHLTYRVQGELTAYAQEGKNAIPFSVDRLPARACMAEFVDHLNATYFDVLEFKSVTTSTGEICGLSWK